MDKKRTKQSNYRRTAGWIIGLTVVVSGGYVALRQAYASTMAVEKNRLTISSVERSPFYEYINVTGTVEPRNTYFIDSKVAGTVEHVLGEIYHMTNPNITAQVDEYYLDKISVGQDGIALVKDDTLNLHVEKVFPTVE